MTGELNIVNPITVNFCVKDPALIRLELREHVVGNCYKYICERIYGNLQIHPRMPTHFEDAKGNIF